MLVEAKQHHLESPFKTQQGAILKNCVVAYEEYGQMDGPVIYICHPAFRDFHAAGRYQKQDPLPGFWDSLIGPGKILDTNRFRIICANSLGSMFGSTSPKTHRADSKKTSATSFPPITMDDMTRFHKLFLDELGVKKLFLMAGASMGGMQALSMGVLYPDFVNAIFTTASAGYLPPFALAMHYYMLDLIKSDPQFENGEYLSGTQLESLKKFGMFCRLIYVNQGIFEKVLSSKNIRNNHATDGRNIFEPYFQTELESFQRAMDANCLITIIEAMNTYHLGVYGTSFEEAVQRIKCPLLIVNFETDIEFPPPYALEIEKILHQKNPGQAVTVSKPAVWGHLGCLFETELFQAELLDFIRKL